MLRKGGTKTRGAMAPRYVRCAGQPILQTTGLVRHRTYAGGTHQSSITWPTLPDTVLLFPFRQPHLPYRPLPRGWYGLGGGAAAGCPGGVQLREGLWTGEPRTQDMSLFMGVNVGEILLSRPKCPAGSGGGKFSDHFVTSVFSSDSPWGGIGPLGWTRPASLGWTRPSGVDSAGPHHFDSIPPAILSGPFCLKIARPSGQGERS